MSVCVMCRHEARQGGHGGSWNISNTNNSWAGKSKSNSWLGGDPCNFKVIKLCVTSNHIVTTNGN